MGPDDNVCYCHHVPLRKLLSYARRHQLQRPSQLSDCLGAGTGCGWCIPVLKRLFEHACNHQLEVVALDLTPEEYARQRQDYLASRGPKNTF